MPIYTVFIINNAGSLMYWADFNIPRSEVEKTFSYPLRFKFKILHERVVIDYGQQDGVKVGYAILGINGQAVDGTRFSCTHNGASKTVDVLEYLGNEDNFPVDIKFGRPRLRANERIVLASTFHSLYEISIRMSPEKNSSGIRQVDTETYRMHCFEAVTGVKFVVITDLRQQTSSIETFLRKLYELYADFALKNPFYSLDQPIRCDLFEKNVSIAVDQFDRTGTVVLS